MTKNSRTSNDCGFTYMLDFMLKPGGKLEYQDNASLSKFKGNPSIDTENRVGNSSAGADLGGGCRGCAPNPPEMKPSSSLLKFVYLTGQ